MWKRKKILFDQEHFCDVSLRGNDEEREPLYVYSCWMISCEEVAPANATVVFLCDVAFQSLSLSHFFADVKSASHSQKPTGQDDTSDYTVFATWRRLTMQEVLSEGGRADHDNNALRKPLSEPMSTLSRASIEVTVTCVSRQYTLSSRISHLRN